MSTGRKPSGLGRGGARGMGAAVLILAGLVAGIRPVSGSPRGKAAGAGAFCLRGGWAAAGLADHQPPGDSHLTAAVVLATWACVVVLLLPAAIFVIFVAVVWWLLTKARRRELDSVRSGSAPPGLLIGGSERDASPSSGIDPPAVTRADGTVLGHIFTMPPQLELVAHFELSGFEGCGGTDKAAFERRVVEQSGLGDRTLGHGSYAFVIRSYLGRRRAGADRQVPDVATVCQAIAEAFTGILYQHDDSRYVRALQAESHWVEDHEERLEVWIWGLQETTAVGNGARSSPPGA